LTKAIKLFPNDINDHYIPTCFQLRAWSYCLSGNYKESIADYTRCKEWDTSYHWCYFRGQTHFYYKHYYEAICDFSEVHKVKRYWAAQLFWRAKSYLKLKEYNKVIEDYTELIERYGYESKDLYLKRGKIFKKLGEFDKAKRDFVLANNIKNKIKNPRRKR
jgi:tetratricopeptide (TPR) repeat protein